jgi:thiamine-phosphate pyrophosphorylase
MPDAEPFADRCLYLVCDASFTRVEEALAGGVDVLQLRDRSLDDRDLLAQAREWTQLAHRHDALFFVNDRPDIALLSGADGVHVGQDDLPPAAVRELAGDRLLIGRSTHSPEQIRAAMDEPVDYIAVGPVHETPTKPGRPAVGLELVELAAREATKPWFAIGGIDLDNVSEVRDSGGTRIAVLRVIAAAHHPRAAATELRDALDR